MFAEFPAVSNLILNQVSQAAELETNVGARGFLSYQFFLQKQA